MMIRAVCDGLPSKQVKSKMLDLPGVPRVGEHLEVAARAGVVVLQATHVLWVERVPPSVAFCPSAMGQTALADVILDQDGWRRDDGS